MFRLRRKSRHIKRHTSLYTRPAQTEEQQMRSDDLRKTNNTEILDEWRRVIEEHIALLPSLANNKMWSQL
jgi:hypothetical protein